VAAKKPKKRSGFSDQNEVGLAALKLLYPILMECNLERWDDAREDADKQERYYDSGLKPIVIDENETEGKFKNFAAAACVFTAGLKERESKIVEITATYLIGVDSTDREKLSESDAKSLLEQAALSSAWPLFRSLFIHLGSQSGLELPLLPNDPKIRWLKPDGTDEKPEAVAST